MAKNSLEHVGVLGMHWGHRKSESHVLTPSHDHMTAEEIKKKHLSEMSNEEITKLATRMDLEKRYQNLNKRDVSSGEKLAKEFLSNNGKKALAGAVGIAGTIAAKLIIEKAMKTVKDPKHQAILKLVVDAAVKKQ